MMEIVSMLLALAIVVVIAFPLGTALRKYSGVFYLIAAVALGVYLWTIIADVRPNAFRWFTFMFQKGYLGTFALALVMFTGALPDSNGIKKALLPIRGELSIMSFIFYIGHIWTYLATFAPKILDLGNLFAQKPNVAVSLVIAIILTVIFVALSIMSFKTIRNAMNPKVWKNIQRLAYPMVALLLCHIVLVLGGSFANLGSKGSIHVMVYAVVIAIYAAMRIYKAVQDKKAAQA